MSFLAQKCIELIDAGKLTIDRIINQSVKAEVEEYYNQKAQTTQQ